MSTATKIAKVALTALALKKLAKLQQHGKHPHGSAALEAAIHTAHANSFGADGPEDDDEDEASESGATGNAVMIDPKKAVAKAMKNVDAAAADLPGEKRSGKPSPLAGKSALRQWAQTPGGRNAPRAQRRG